MIPQEVMTEDLHDIIQACKKNSENLISMVSNILDFAKLKSKKLELDLQPYNIKELLSNIIDMHSVKAKSKNLKMSLSIDSESIPD